MTSESARAIMFKRTRGDGAKWEELNVGYYSRKDDKRVYIFPDRAEVYTPKQGLNLFTQEVFNFIEKDDGEFIELVDA